MAAFAAEQPPAAPAAPAPDADRDAPAAPPNPYAGLTREQKQALLHADPDLQEEARSFARREIDKREQAAREAQQREQQVRQQYDALNERLETLRLARQIALDPFHEHYAWSQQYLQEHTGQDERQLLRAQVMADPEFQGRMSAYQQQVHAAAVEAAIEQGREHAKGVGPERYAALRADPNNNTVPLFYAALFREDGWLPPDVAKKEIAAAREEGRRQALGDWEVRDFAPSLGDGRGGNGGTTGGAPRGEARLRAAFLADERRATNGQR
jgi:hypothetical protein